MITLVIAVGVLIHRAADVVRGVAVRGVAAGDSAVGAPPVPSPAFPQIVGLLVGTSILPGHELTLLRDRQLFDALLADLGAARRSITFFAYYCEPGRAVDQVVAALTERARAGVRVFFMGDGFSCADVLEAVRPGLEAAGASVAVHRPVELANMHKLQHRNHARMVVIDGAVAYTGGFGLADEWLGAAGAPPWRETSVRFTGPAVSQVQAAFLIDWAEATGMVQAGPAFLPQPPEPGVPAHRDAEPPPVGSTTSDVVAGFFYSSPGIGTTAAERLFALTLGGARARIRVTNAYFVPTALLRGLLIDAARRGVDVGLLLPGPQIDVPTTRWAGRGFYEELLRAGVRIWEYEPTVLHAKTVTVDGVWSVVGSLNFDNRSIRLNDEGALLVHDARIAAELDAAFDADLAQARPITLESHRARGLWTRFLERLTRLVAPLL